MSSFNDVHPFDLFSPTGIYPFVGGPSGRDFTMHQKYVHFENSLLVGRSGLQTCDDAVPSDVIKAASSMKGAKSPSGGNLGMTSAQFLGSLGDIVDMGFIDWSGDYSLGGYGRVASKSKHISKY